MCYSVLRSKDSVPDDSRSRLENLKYYISLVLGTLCIVCIFAFLFLVPFVLDPAISTLMHKVGSLRVPFTFYTVLLWSSFNLDTLVVGCQLVTKDLIKRPH